MNNRGDKQTFFHSMVVLILRWKSTCNSNIILILMPNVILEETIAGMRFYCLKASSLVFPSGLGIDFASFFSALSYLFSAKFQSRATVGYMQGFAPRTGNVLWPLFKNVLLLEVQLVLLRFVLATSGLWIQFRVLI